MALTEKRDAQIVAAPVSGESWAGRVYVRFAPVQAECTAFHVTEADIQKEIKSAQYQCNNNTEGKQCSTFIKSCLY
jgi:hypothetical protein